MRDEWVSKELNTQYLDEPWKGMVRFRIGIIWKWVGIGRFGMGLEVIPVNI